MFALSSVSNDLEQERMQARIDADSSAGHPHQPSLPDYSFDGKVNGSGIRRGANGVDPWQKLIGWPRAEISGFGLAFYPII